MASSARIEELEKKFNENPRRYFAPLANEYRKAGEIEQAIALCRAYLPQQPGHMSGHIVFGQALFDSGELDEAQKVFETALSLDPENLIALRHLGDIAHSRGDLAGARNWYQRVLDADPRNEEIAAQLAALGGDTAGVAPEGTPQEGAGSVGWGDINPERAAEPGAAASAAAGNATAAAVEPQAEVAAEQVAPADPPLEVEHVSQADDDLDKLFEKAQGGTPARASGSAPPITDDEDTVEHPKFELAPGERELTLDDPIPVTETVPEPAPPQEEAQEPAAAEPAAAAQPAAVDNAPSEPAAAPTDDLGLEVAEFVPPSADQTAPALGFETGHEAVVGGPIGEVPGGGRTSRETPEAFVTETMAELYLQQGFVQEALNVYRQLLEQNPEDEGLRERVAQLEQGARSSVSMAAVSDEVVEAARRRQASPSRRSMRQFLGALAVRRAPQRRSDPGQQAVPAEEPEPEGSAAGPDIPMLYEPEAAEASEPQAIDEWPELASDEEAAAPPPAEMPGIVEVRSEPETGDDQEGLDALFAGTGVDPSDQAAASTLAGAFDSSTIPPSPTGPRGRPSRAAPSELSLDSVFREAGGDSGLQKPRSDFSFDQFFSDDASSTPARDSGGASKQPADSDAPSGDDIGQFNAWLEGLKKK